MSAAHRLQTARAPWVYLLPLAPSQTPEAVLALPPSILLKALDGRHCSTKDRLLAHLAHTLAFPDYFGANWDALEECLCDLEWLPAEGYLLLVRHADQLLADEASERVTWLRILRSAGTHWADQEPPRPFHTVLTVEAARPFRYKGWRIPLWKPQ